jgi:hypothetical protein
MVKGLELKGLGLIKLVLTLVSLIRSSSTVNEKEVAFDLFIFTFVTNAIIINPCYKKQYWSKFSKFTKAITEMQILYKFSMLHQRFARLILWWKRNAWLLISRPLICTIPF